MEKFDQLKTVDCKHLTRLYGVVSKHAVTDPIMIGVNQNGKPFIILTFDVYSSQETKIAKKVSEVFHDNPCCFEWDYKPEIWKKILQEKVLGVETWQRVYQVDNYIYPGYGMPISEIAERIRTLLHGDSIMKPRRFNGEEEIHIKLWKNDSPESWV